MKSHKTGDTRDLIANVIEKIIDQELNRATKLDDQARSLVISVLVVIGFLFAAGTTSVVDMKSLTSLLYFIGLGLLVSSIFTVFIILCIKGFIAIHDIEKFLSYQESANYELLVEEIEKEISFGIESNFRRNNYKQRLLIIAWLFLIIGLIVVMSFIISDVILK